MCWHILGFFISVIIGHFVTAPIIYKIRKWQSKREHLGNVENDEWKYIFGIYSFPRAEINGKPTDIKELPPYFLGMIERLFFTAIIFAGMSGVPIAMVAWIALKAANNWSFWMKQKLEWSPYLNSAFIGGIISMLLALIGGMVCRLGLHP